jgi:uncharacterized protein (TIGR00251 family)
VTAGLPSWLRVVDGAVEVRLRVVPRSSRNRIAGTIGDDLKVQVSAPPVEGAANEAVLELLAKVAGLPRRAASLVSGAASRTKTVRLETEDPAGTAARLASAAVPVR